MVNFSHAHRWLAVLVAMIVVPLAACGSSDDEPVVSETTTATTVDSTGTTAPDTGEVGASAIWVGDLDGRPIQFRIEVDPDGGVEGYFDSLSEAVTDIPATGTVEGDSVTLEVVAAGIEFDGVVDGDELNGTWSQSGVELPLLLERRDEALVVARPRSPSPRSPTKPQRSRSQLTASHWLEP